MQPDNPEDPLTKWRLAAPARDAEHEAMREVRKLHGAAEHLEAGLEAAATALELLHARLVECETRLAALEGRKRRKASARARKPTALPAGFLGPRRDPNNREVHYSQPLVTSP
jgi:hypothetical protein